MAKTRTVARNARGRFVSTKTTAITRSSPRTITVRRARSSPYVVASRRSRGSGGAYAPVKSGIAGLALGTIETRFATTFQRLPEILGTRWIAAAGVLHFGRRHIPHGSRAAESASTIAGYEVGKSGKLLSLSGGGDDF